MSSHRVSASGDRQYTLTAGGGQFTALQMPSKATDGATVSVGSVSKIEIPLPARGVRLERHKAENGSIQQILVIEGIENVLKKDDGSEERWPGQTSLLALCAPALDKNGEIGNGLMHTNIDVRRYDLDSGYALSARSGAVESETIDLAIPPTETETHYADGSPKASAPVDLPRARQTGPAPVVAGEEFPGVR